MIRVGMVLCLVLCGCVDHGKCLQSHTETWFQPLYMPMCDSKGYCTQQLIGMQPMEYEVCDQWEYPNGRGK